ASASTIAARSTVVVSRNVPDGAASASGRSANDDCSAAIDGATRAYSASPADVVDTRRVVRRNSDTPSAASSAATARLRVERGRFSRAAAVEKLPVSCTAMNARTRLRSIGGGMLAEYAGRHGAP